MPDPIGRHAVRIIGRLAAPLARRLIAPTAINIRIAACPGEGQRTDREDLT
ncbi:hypothetical protein QE385_000074 [Sphingomonas sp. SORGH_AS 950]|uniref:hypothetical protein n=1 Tax=Sphingomonas sp. SORGH_AS_0950 TaxID=3041792 RepID=UPI00278426D4|nr:hypothetical protein [Sphingomonas sp. SORGH_AS_0950]MDQ1155747.1 hypothetical protein [Sphingomonas sp. SORGH_AS_0950]